MTTQTEALKIARTALGVQLDALLGKAGHLHNDDRRRYAEDGIKAIDFALAQQSNEQVEPVAWRWIPSDVWGSYVLSDSSERAKLADEHGLNPQPLYTTTPPQHQCKGIPRNGCNYLTACDMPCNKCGEIHHHHQMVWNHDHPPVPTGMQMDVIVVNLVREGINKHRARELAEHFIKHTTPPVPNAKLTAQPKQCWKCGDMDAEFQTKCDVPACGMKEPEQTLKLMPREATPEMLKAMDECSMEGYDERLYAGHAGSVYMAAWDAFHGQHCYCGDIINLGVIHRDDGPCHYPENTSEYKRGYADAMNWKVQNHLEHLPTAQPKEPEQEPVAQWQKRHIADTDGMWCDTNAADAEWWQSNKKFGWEVRKFYTTPPQRTWVGLTDDEIDQGLLRSDYAFKTAEAWRAGVVFSMTKLKEKNTK